jgi:hypothetical protein
MKRSKKSNNINIDPLVKLSPNGYKYAEDWREINDNLLKKANEKIIEIELQQSTDPSALIAAKAVKERLVGTKKYQKTDHAHEIVWCQFRNFVASYLNKIQPRLQEECPTPDDIIAFLTYSFRHKKVYLTFTVGGTDKKIRCKGNKIGSLQKYRAAFEWAFLKCGYDNLFLTNENIVNLYKMLSYKVVSKYGYQRKQAKFFNIWSDFDKIRNHCLQERGDLHGLRSWTMVLLMFALFLRRADITYLKVEGIGIPRHQVDNSLVLDEDGYPRYIRIWLSKSKGDGTGIGTAVKFELMRNYRDRKLCPVVALLDYLNFSGITSGYIFRNFQSGSSTRFRSDEPMSVHDVSEILSELFSSVFSHEHGFSTHSPRRTAAMFAAICRATDTEIKRAGRWSSNVFMEYVSAGRHTTLASVLGAAPEIQDRWTWFPIR